MHLVEVALFKGAYCRIRPRLAIESGGTVPHFRKWGFGSTRTITPNSGADNGKIMHLMIQAPK